MAAGEEDKWVTTMEQLYPNLLTEPYFVPPVYFNRVPWKPVNVGGEKVMVPHIASSEPSPRTSRSDSARSPQSELHYTPFFPHPPEAMYETASGTQGEVGAFKTREDFAQQHVLMCLQELFAKRLGQTRSEPLFVVSQLKFDNYLDKTDPALRQLLPIPKNWNLRGDFDILVIHRVFGVLIGEIKSVGLRDDGIDPNAVIKRVTKAAEQLLKATETMKLMARDIHADLVVRTTLILPYVSRSKLQEILSQDTELTKMLCKSLGADPGDLPAALQLCLCEDDLSDRANHWEVSQDKMKRLQWWWDRRMPTSDPGMTDAIYKRIVARVCGPCTTISVHCVNSPRLEVKTLAQAVAELGFRQSLLMLTQPQLDLLNREPRAVCLNGPPGTGKSIVLVMKGLIALSQEDGCDVIVLSTTPYSLAVSKLIHKQLTMTLLEQGDGGVLGSAGQGTADRNIPVTDETSTTEASMAEQGSAEQTTPEKDISDAAEEDVFMTEHKTQEEAKSPEQDARAVSHIVKKPRTSDSVVESKTGEQKTGAEANIVAQKTVEEPTADSNTVGDSSTSDLKTVEESTSAGEQETHILAEPTTEYATPDGDRGTIYHQSTEGKANQSPLVERVHLKVYDLLRKPDVDEVVTALEAMAQKAMPRELCVLMDEADFYERIVGPASQKLVRRLLKHPSLGKKLILWAACMQNNDIPEELTSEKLTQPLRSTPRICREVQSKTGSIPNVDKYDMDSGIPPHADGVDHIIMKHQPEHGGHEGEWPINCEQCGRELAGILQKDLRVGVSDGSTTPPNPQYRDVFVLTRSADLHEEYQDKHASGLVRGLRDKGLPVGVLGWRRDDPEGWQRELDNLAVAKTNQVTVARWRAVDGLERKIVAFVPGRDQKVDSQQTPKQVLENDYLHLVSRASAQLIIITMPESQDNT